MIRLTLAYATNRQKNTKKRTTKDRKTKDTKSKKNISENCSFYLERSKICSLYLNFSRHVKKESCDLLWLNLCLLSLCSKFSSRQGQKLKTCIPRQWFPTFFASSSAYGWDRYCTVTIRVDRAITILLACWRITSNHVTIM
jgi:hypothetical protein